MKFNINSRSTPFLIQRVHDDAKYWFIFIDLYKKDDFYLSILEGSRYILGPHKIENEDNLIFVTYKYEPRLHDGNNDKRKSRFEKLTGNLEQKIQLPNELRTLDDFIEDVFVLSHNKLTADDLTTPLSGKTPDDEPPPKKNAMPRPLNTILYGPPGTGKTYATVRRCVKIRDGAAKGSDKKIRKRYHALTNADRVEFITFHQSYGYEEFVEGLRPVTASAETEEDTRSARRTGGDARRSESSAAGAGAANGPGFRLVPTPGVLRRIAERARKKPREAHILVIDEINRADVSKVMGELITLLEEDKRKGAENELTVTLPHSDERFTLPANLHFLGAMNTADRSIALLDKALRRRFEFEEIPPQPEKLGVVDGIDLPEVLRAMNERLEWLIGRDHLIGHAWLMKAHSRKDLDRVMRRKIIPLIAEYFYNDWEKVHAVLGGTDDFVGRQLLDPPPGLDDMGEKRYRWTVRQEFSEEAYDRLVKGPSESSTDAGDAG